MSERDAVEKVRDEIGVCEAYHKKALESLSPGDRCGPDGSCVVVDAAHYEKIVSEGKVASDLWCQAEEQKLALRDELTALRKVAEAARNWSNLRGRDAGLYEIAKQRLERAISALSEGEE